MTKDELAQRLDHLDPGGQLSVDRHVLAELLGAAGGDFGTAAEAFAEAHRCTFADRPEDGDEARFVKNDVF